MRHARSDLTSKPVSDFSSRIQDALAGLGDAGKAKAMAAYMKGKFDFLGIQTPARRQATAPLLRVFTGHPLVAAQALWALPEREYQYVAVDLLRLRNGQLTAADLPALEALVQDKSWWDSVDGLAVAIGDIVVRQPRLRHRMDELIDAHDFWLRRIALLHQLGLKQETDAARLFAYCLHCADEREFFIRKAIGWALRQYARTNPAAVRQFLDTNREKLSGLSFREAAKHL
jgi:3-methyladenine DNA glycosylase AlkD